MTAMSQTLEAYCRTLQRLLSDHGLEAGLPELATQVGSDGALDRVRSLLEAKGKDARLVRVTVGDLSRLALPTLIGMEGQYPCLVRQVGRFGVLIERGTRVERVRRSSLAQGMSGAALEIESALEGRASFVHRVLHAARGQWDKLLALSLLTLLGSGLSLAGPAITRHMFDSALPDRAYATLRLLVLALMGVAFQRVVAGLLRDRATRGLEVALSRAMLKDALSRMFAAPLAQASAGTLGESLQVLSSSESVLAVLRQLVASTLFDAVTSLLVLSALYTAFPSLLPLLLAVLLLTFGASLLFGLRDQRLVRAVLQASERERTRLHELLAGIFTYRAFGAERSGVSRWLGELLTERAASIRRDRNELWFDAWLELGQQVTLLGAFYWGGQAALAGELSVGDVVAGLMLLDQLSSASRRTATSIVPWLSVAPHVARVEAATCWGELPRAQPASKATAAEFAIQMDDVWFRYGPNEPWLLRGYNLSVRRGEHLHLTGASGAGKTTILRLIAGLYTPERGSVLVQGENPARRSGGLLYVPQAAHLFEGSIEQNLRNLSGASRPEILQAAGRTGLLDWLSTLPMQLDTVVPPGGGNLSGGQRQWILLTAAAASSRPIVLLDEPTSQIDRFTREQLRIEQLFTGKTVVYAAHDL